MMRLGRRASLLVALFLLTSAATAYAEGAWVSWVTIHTTFRQKDGSIDGKRSTELVKAFPTVVECAASLRKEEQRARALAHINTRISAEPLELSITKDFRDIEDPNPEILGKLLLSQWFWKCLPDTVDPRGLKGK